MPANEHQPRPGEFGKSEILERDGRNAEDLVCRVQQAGAR